MKKSKEDGDAYYQKLLDEELKRENPDWKQVRQYMGFQVRPSPPDADTGMSIYHKAALQGVVDVMRWALANLPDPSYVNAKNKFGRSPLHFACDAGHSDIVLLLLDVGKADVNVSSLGGLTPLHVAVRQRQAECVKLLLSHGADTLAETSERQTANMLTNDPEILAILDSTGSPKLKIN